MCLHAVLTLNQVTMPIYHSLGKKPQKRHTTFQKEGGGYYYEQLFGTEGFHGMASLLYHTHRPTEVKAVLESLDVAPKIAFKKSLMARRLIGFSVPSQD